MGAENFVPREIAEGQPKTETEQTEELTEKNAKEKIEKYLVALAELLEPDSLEDIKAIAQSMAEEESELAAAEWLQEQIDQLSGE